MHYKWPQTGIGKIDNLGRQLEKVMKNCNQGSIETRYRYVAAAERFVKHAAQKFNLQKVQNIQDKHLESYAKELQERGCSDKYIKNELSAIRFIHNQVPDAKYDLREAQLFNKEIGLGETKDGRADRAWTEREVKEIKDLAESMNRLEVAKIIEGIRHTGMRLDEASTLRRDAVENALKTGYLHLENTKGGRPRDVQLTEKVREYLEKSIQNVGRGEYVFCPKSYVERHAIHKFEKSVERFIYNHRDKVQDPDRNSSGHNVNADQRGALTAHGLRHTYGREEYLQRVESGMSSREAYKEVAEQLGHSRESITLIYTGGK